LFSEAARAKRSSPLGSGRWRFVLQSVEDESKLEVQDREPAISADRLELLAVVRGLEALDQPSRVTLVTPSRYVSRGLRYGLEEWRDNRWRWEHHGRMVPIKNDDLWRRVDQAMKYHRVDCRVWRFDNAHSDLHRSPSRAGGVVDARPAQCGQRTTVLARVAQGARRWIGRWLVGSTAGSARTAA
jgi:ribonuclease HI